MIDLQLPTQGYFRSLSQFQFSLRLPNQGLLSLHSTHPIRLALHKGTNRLYAIKLCPLSQYPPNQSYLKLLKREIAIHSQLDHPHIIKLWSAFIEDNEIVIVMEYAQNNSLVEYIKQKGRLSQPQAFKYFYQTLKSIQYLHKCDVLHRDLKPQNILLDQNFNIKLSEFGWSTTDLTMCRNTMCGTTKEHMPPQMINELGYDWRVDVWGLGLLLYEMVEGETPFKGDTEEEVKGNMMQGLRVGGKVSMGLRGLLERLLAIEAGNRPSVQEILEDQWVYKMKLMINSNLKNQTDLSPSYLNEKINKLMPAPTHKKTSSTNLPTTTLTTTSSTAKKESPNININFMINNYASNNKKSFDRQSTEQIKKLGATGYKTYTENSKDIIETGNNTRKFDKAHLFGGIYPQYAKVLSKIKSSQDFPNKEISKKINRRKSQQSIISSAHIGGHNNKEKMEAIRTVTQTSQKKRSSKKKKTYDDLTTLLKKVGSGSDLFCRKSKV